MIPLIAFAAAALDSQPPSPAELVQRIRRAYASVRSVKMRAEISFTPDDGEERVAEYQLDRDGDSARIVLSSGSVPLFTQILRSNQTVYMKSAAGATLSMGKQDRAAHPEDQQEGPSLKLIDFSADTARLTAEKGGIFSKGDLFVDAAPPLWRGRRWIALEEVRKDSRVRYYVDPSTYFVWRASLTDPESKQVLHEWKITDLATNVKVDPKLFRRP